ncbi:MAG: hypothetical protein U0V75_17840 [Ferruginibacter sp.]
MVQLNKIAPVYLLLFFSCSQLPSTDQKTQEKKDSVSITENTHDLAPLSDSKDIMIENETYNLTITQYPPNQVFKDLAIIILKKSNQIVVSDSVSYKTFSDSLQKLNINSGVQMSVVYDFVRSNRLYFLATFNSQKANTTDTIHFALFYRTNKKGQLTYWTQ